MMGKKEKDEPWQYLRQSGHLPPLHNLEEILKVDQVVIEVCA